MTNTLILRSKKLGVLALLLALLVISGFSAFPVETHAQSNGTSWQNEPLVCTELEHRLRFGSRDRTTDGEVSELQKFLRAEGYLHSRVTGFFGFATYRAVVMFQADEGLRRTGTTNTQTRAAIEEVSCTDDTDPGPLDITKIDAPTRLAVGEEGDWTVHVNTTATGTLRYSVVWGDEVALRMSARSVDTALQASASFTHVYNTPGTYTPRFTVTTENGDTVSEAAATVIVSDDLDVTITSLSKVKGYADDKVAIAGTGFSSTSVVYLGTEKVAHATVTSTSSITFTVPSLKAGTYAVRVENENGTSNTVNFTVLVKDTTTLSITGVDAPLRLKVNEDGTWTVHIRTNATGTLHYSAVWGDEGTLRTLLRAGLADTQASSTFTHRYVEDGTYRPKFTVSDDAGHKASVSATVVVSE